MDQTVQQAIETNFETMNETEPQEPVENDLSNQSEQVDSGIPEEQEEASTAPPKEQETVIGL